MRLGKGRERDRVANCGSGYEYIHRSSGRDEEKGIYETDKLSGAVDTGLPIVSLK